MAIKPISKSSFLRLTTYAKATAHRISTVLLILFALLLLFVNRLDEDGVNLLKGFFSDFSVYTINMIGKPAESISYGIDKIFTTIDIYRNNEKLLNENDSLKVWKEKAISLEIENKKLKKLLNSVNEKEVNSITSRILANSGGGFVKTLTIDAGKKDGVKIGQAVVNISGMIGRTVEVGSNASRVLLVTDLNSQIPVLTEKTGHRAILSGDNSALLYLKFLYYKTISIFKRPIECCIHY